MQPSRRSSTVLLVGLTGGIGAGKSTVAELLTERGAIVIDADVIARRVVEPGQPALAAIVERFGPEVLAADGTLDRPALAAKAFATDEDRKALEAITHPGDRRRVPARDERGAAGRDRRQRRAAARGVPARPPSGATRS